MEERDSMRLSSIKLLPVVGLVMLVATGAALAGPKIQFKSTKYDWGSAPQGSKIPLTYDFKNVGDKTLTIDAVHTSCGCTNAEASSKSVAPGKSAKITAVFNSSGYKGKVMKTITVDTNDPDQKNIQLNASGNVKANVEVFPGRINFGVLKPGRTFTQTLVVKTVNPGKIWPVGAEASANYITVTPPVKSKSTKGAWEIHVTVKGGQRPAGRVYDSIAIRTNQQNAGLQTVGVSGNLVE